VIRHCRPDLGLRLVYEWPPASSPMFRTSPLVCDKVCCAGDHVVYLWTFTGTHSGTKNPLRVVGWEEWDLDADLKVKASRGWFDADDYGRQTAGE
jgi:hypothetical protein